MSDWISAGTRCVWIVDPVKRTGRIYRADRSLALLAELDPFGGEDILPGFSCTLASVLG